MRKTEIEQAARAKVATFLPSKVIRFKAPIYIRMTNACVKSALIGVNNFLIDLDWVGDYSEGQPTK